MNLYEKFQEHMNNDINRSHGGFFSSYGQAFSSLGLSGKNYMWCLLLSKLLYYRPRINSCLVVQRWYSGMFGVETLSWWDSHSAVEIWKNNEKMLKQKYRMHNLYVQVSLVSKSFIFRFKI